MDGFFLIRERRLVRHLIVQQNKVRNEEDFDYHWA